MTEPLFNGIGGPRALNSTDEWLTPPDMLAKLGPFDLDPCAPVNPPWPTARRMYTVLDNGLLLPWVGRTWLNPPYDPREIPKWMGRMVHHGHGTALVFARTCTRWFFDNVWNAATALLFVEGFVFFRRVDGSRGKHGPGAPSVLVAYGMNDTDVLASCDIDGQFIPLRIPRSVLGHTDATTWAKLLERHMAGRGPVHLDDLYREVATTAKAKANPNFQAKVRQELQQGRDRGRYLRHRPGLWEAASKGTES